VIIASHGKAQVKIVPCVFSTGLKRPESLVGVSLDLPSAQVEAPACLLAGPAAGPASVVVQARIGVLYRLYRTRLQPIQIALLLTSPPRGQRIRRQTRQPLPVCSPGPSWLQARPGHRCFSFRGWPEPAYPEPSLRPG